MAGKAGQAGQFNGASSSGSTTVPILNTSQSFTVSTWVKLTNLTGTYTAASQDGVTVSGFYLQYAQSLGNKFSFEIMNADGTNAASSLVTSISSPVAGQWYHVVGVRDKTAGTIKLYVNGALQATKAYTAAWAANGTFNVGRAKWGGNVDWFNGAIDEVSTYATALSDSEVAQLYSGSTPNAAPTVSLTAPTANAVFTQGTAIDIAANASDDGSVAQVEFYDGATLIGTDTTAPYGMSLTNAALGSHSFTAKATDNLGLSTTSAAITVTVNTAGNQAPTVSLTAPTANAVFTQGTAIDIAANASDDDSVAQVEFYDGATLIETDTTAPYGMSLTNAALGSHSFTAKATDNLGLSTTSAAIAVTVNAVSAITSSGNWKFDEASGNTVADSSGNAHPLTLTNVTRVAGKAGQAGQFNGASSSGSTTVPILNTSQSFTVSTWVKLTNLTGTYTAASQDGVTVSGFYLQYAQSLGNKFSFEIMNADGTNAASSLVTSISSPVAGQWYHVVGVRDKTAGTIKLYVNGALQATKAYTAAWAANGTFNVGRAKWGGNVDWFNGAIDEVSTYATALSDSEVAQLYNNGN